MYWLVSGTIGLVSLIWDRTQWGWKVFGGILGVVAGIGRDHASACTRPSWWLARSSIFMGILALVFGVMNLVRAFSAGGGWGMGLLGALDVIIGFFLIVNPLAGAIALPIVLGAFILVGGIASIIMAFRMG